MAHDPNFDPIPDPDPNGVTNDQIGEAAEALEGAEDIWDVIARQSAPLMACPECGSGGHVSAGTLGTHQCFRCNGTRAIVNPLADDEPPKELADLKAARRQLTESRTAWRDRQTALREGRAQLPAGADPGVVAKVLDTARQAVKTAKTRHQLAAGAAPAQPALPAPHPDDDLVAGGGGFSDDELDELEAYDKGAAVTTVPEGWGPYYDIARRLRGVDNHHLDNSVRAAMGMGLGAVGDTIVDMMERHAALLSTVTAPAPIPMLLWCPSCGDRHVDLGEFATKPHHTHACQSCGMVWRPAVVDTVGVQFLPGYKNGNGAPR